jgi:hypothetical protein
MIITVHNVNPGKLHNELIQNGVVPMNVLHNAPEGEALAETATIELDESTDTQIVEQIIASHDPTPLTQPPTAEERLASIEAAILTLMEVLANV